MARTRGGTCRGRARSGIKRAPRSTDDDSDSYSENVEQFLSVEVVQGVRTDGSSDSSASSNGGKGTGSGAGKDDETDETGSGEEVTFSGFDTLGDSDDSSTDSADSDDDSDGEADEAEPSAAPKTPVVIGLLPKSSDVTAPGTSRRRKHSESSVVPVKKKRSRKSKFQRLYTDVCPRCTQAYRTPHHLRTHLRRCGGRCPKCQLWCEKPHLERCRGPGRKIPKVLCFYCKRLFAVTSIRRHCKRKHRIEDFCLADHPEFITAAEYWSLYEGRRSALPGPSSAIPAEESAEESTEDSTEDSVGGSTGALSDDPPETDPPIVASPESGETERLKEELEAKEVENELLRTEKFALQTRLAELEEQLSVQIRQSEAEGLRKEVVNLERKAAELRRENDLLTSELTGQQEQHEEEVSNLDSVVQEVRQRLSEKEAECEAKSAEILASQERERGRKEEAEAGNVEKQMLKETVASLSSELGSVRAELRNVLEQLKRKIEVGVDENISEPEFSGESDIAGDEEDQPVAVEQDQPVAMEEDQPVAAEDDQPVAAEEDVPVAVEKDPAVAAEDAQSDADPGVGTSTGPVTEELSCYPEVSSFPLSPDELAYFQSEDEGNLEVSDAELQRYVCELERTDNATYQRVGADFDDYLAIYLFEKEGAALNESS